MRISAILMMCFFIAAFGLAACGDDEGTEADRAGVAAQCASTEDCSEATECLTAFKGGYCGIQGCEANADCPAGSACVAHDDGNNYCFRICADKAECNLNRSPDNEANCSSSVTFVEADFSAKACIPPSG
jgi:hypothetical protein